ncbi:MAG: radical SAM family heme chaperone HemW, partial [Thermoanaerobaculia bacterium]
IYVHVPFCRTRCRYCDFYRVGENRARMDRFLDGLAREIEGARPWHGRRVESVFFGGGTPSLFEPEEIGALLARLARRFALAPGAEVTLEGNPSDLTRARLENLRAAGVNRLSVGAQSFVERELRLLGRRHDAARVAEVVRDARAAGFESLSLDLMIGIPGQTDGSFSTSLARAIELEPDHLSLYLLEVHAGSEMDALRRERPGLFAGEEAHRRRYLAMRARLTATGYRHYEISNFARPGAECRHNLRYWRCEDWLGLGPAAHSFVDGRRFRHLPDLEAWLADPLAVEELVADPAAERVFLGLRLEEGIDPRRLEDAGVPAAEVRRRIARLSGFVEIKDGRLRLTPDGLLVSNPVLAELLR